MPACTALPYSPSSSPDTLRRQGEKWICLGLRVDEVFPGSPTESLRPAEPPFSKEKLLVGVFGVQVVEPLPWVPRSGRKSPPAARGAPRLHAAEICGLSQSHPPRPESPSRGAGRTMELGAGPAGAARPRRRPSARLAVALERRLTPEDGARRWGAEGLTRLKVKVPSLDVDPQIWSSPPRPPATPARKQPLLELFLQHRSPEHRATEWVGGSGEIEDEQLHPRPLWSFGLHSLGTCLHVPSLHCPTPPNK